MFADTRDIVLARGLTDAAGARHRRARLQPMDGRAEVSLGADQVAGWPAATDALLAGRLGRLGGYAPVAAELVAQLSCADRDQLALEIRTDLFGDRLLLTAACENPDCGERVDLDLSVAKLIGQAVQTPETVIVDTDLGRVTIRPPLGLDDPEAEQIWPDLTIEGPDWAALSEADRQRLALALARTEARPELGIAAPCPSCRLLIEIEIDPVDLLSREVRLGASRLMAEIHCLAFHYGWSEAEILALPRTRRWRYLELIADQVTGRPLADGWR